jgi:cobaltochelatase CobN
VGLAGHTPDLVKNWAWDEVKAVYFDDTQKLGLPQFLGQDHNAHVKAHMLAIFMVAAEKGYWKTDAATIRKMGGELSQLVARNGLPGSGHTAPNHPMWEWLAPQLDAADAQALGVTLAKARGESLPATAATAAAAPAPGRRPQAAARQRYQPHHRLPRRAITTSPKLRHRQTTTAPARSPSSPCLPPASPCSRLACGAGSTPLNLKGFFHDRRFLFLVAA